ncbi:MAG: type II toxin-antitoxin system YoeB family toxin [Mycobacterium sp.]|nr:type II toxin-antitoxin system YoeB family toxin [Mycobacterium sp.]
MIDATGDGTADDFDSWQAGIGKPEPLKGELPGYWSQRTDDEHRLVYRADAAAG